MPRNWIDGLIGIEPEATVDRENRASARSDFGWKNCKRSRAGRSMCDEIALETLDVPTRRRVREAPQADGGLGGV